MFDNLWNLSEYRWNILKHRWNMLENEWNMLEYVGSHNGMGVRGYESHRNSVGILMEYAGILMNYVGQFMEDVGI